MKQRDAVGLTLFADRVVSHIPPRAKARQLDDLLHAIVANPARPVSDASRAFHEAAELASRRGLVVIISDLFDEMEAITSGLDHAQYENHEVLILHVLDPWEHDLPLEGNIRFHDLETGETLTTQVEAVRDRYLEAVGQWRAALDRECRGPAPSTGSR